MHMLRYAEHIVQYCIDHQLGIIVGDNPAGIDDLVVAYTRTARYPITVVGCSNMTIRCGTDDLHEYIQLPVTSWAMRDQYMVDQCCRALFIWNGTSPGTLAGYRYARSIGKRSDLIKFSLERE